MLCTNCRAKIPNDTQICPYCGDKIENYSFPNTYHNPSSTVNTSHGSSVMSKITTFVIAGIIIVSTFVTTVSFFAVKQSVDNSPVESSENIILEPEGEVVFSHELTVDKVIELAELKDKLSWEHFGMFDYQEKKYDERTGYQMITYRIENDCYIHYLVIKGIKGQKPDDILFYESRKGFDVDIRDTEDFEKFRNTHMRVMWCD